MHFKYEEKNYSIERYPSSDNKSLRAWSAADEYLLKYLKENNISYKQAIQTIRHIGNPYKGISYAMLRCFPLHGGVFLGYKLFSE